jgi:hypothetical protein
VLSKSQPKQPLISIKEAKKLLGKDGRSLSDDEVLEVIKLLSLLAREQLTKQV